MVGGGCVNLFQCSALALTKLNNDIFLGQSDDMRPGNNSSPTGILVFWSNSTVKRLSKYFLFQKMYPFNTGLG